MKIDSIELMVLTQGKRAAVRKVSSVPAVRCSRAAICAVRNGGMRSS